MKQMIRELLEEVHMIGDGPLSDDEREEFVGLASAAALVASIVLRYEATIAALEADAPPTVRDTERA